MKYLKCITLRLSKLTDSRIACTTNHSVLKPSHASSFFSKLELEDGGRKGEKSSKRKKEVKERAGEHKRQRRKRKKEKAEK